MTTPSNPWFEAIDEEMRKLVTCTSCGADHRAGDLIDRTTFRIVTLDGVRCRKVRMRYECPSCHVVNNGATRTGPWPLGKTGEEQSPIEAWRKWVGLPPLVTKKRLICSNSVIS